MNYSFNILDCCDDFVLFNVHKHWKNRTPGILLFHMLHVLTPTNTRYNFSLTLGVYNSIDWMIVEEIWVVQCCDMEVHAAVLSLSLVDVVNGKGKTPQFDAVSEKGNTINQVFTELIYN